MAYLTKSQVKEIVQNAPDKSAVLDQLVKRGHILEGYNEPKEKTFGEETAKQYSSTFTPKTDEGLVISLAKQAGNIPSSLFGVAKGLLHGVTTVPIEAGKAALEVASNVQYMSGKDIWESLKGIPEELYKGLVPEATQHLFAGNIEKAQQVIEADPIGQILPYVLLGREGAIKAGKGAEFDAVISKIAKPVIEPPSRFAKGSVELGSEIAKYGTSQATGMSRETISRIISNPDEFSPDLIKKYTREGVATETFQAIKSRLDDLSETGKEYRGVRELTEPVLIPETTITGVLNKHGVSVDKGRLIFTKESIPTSAADRSALQGWYTMYGKEKLHTPNSFLNARKGLDNLAQFDMAKTDAVNVFARDLRASLNKAGRPQISGLEELDLRFSSETQALKGVKKDYFNSDGTLKDNAISKISNLSNTGRESVLARLEDIVPGIAERVKTLKAVEDIQAAGGQKVGTYLRTVPLAGGYAVGGIAGAVVGAILASPEAAVPILRGYAKILGVKDSVTMRIIKEYNPNMSVETGKSLFPIVKPTVKKK